MGVRFRDDVVASFRLARSEWWLAVDLLAGLAGYVVWVAGSAALGLQLASLAEYPVAPDGTPTTPVLAALAVFWLVLPAAIGVARVGSRLLNIRGNVKQAYRFDRPAALLVPPVVLVAIVLGAAVTMGTVVPLLLVAFVPATIYLLVRSLAFSYRVFSFSHPSILYVGVFATLTVQAGVLLSYLGVATENAALVTGAVDAVGLSDPLATVDLAVVAAPTGLAVAAAVPIGFVAAYALVQSAAALLVRSREPTVRPSRVRTGQRYPPGLDVASNGGRTTATEPSGKQTPASTADGSTSDDSADREPTKSTPSTESPSASGTDAATADSSTAPTGTAGPATDENDVPDEEAESVSHTRVFTPPDGADDDPLSSGSADGDAKCPDCGATVPADADRCPACGGDAR